MMKTSVLSLGVLLGLSMFCGVSNGQNVRDPISRKFQPQHGFFESKSSSAKQVGVLRTNPTYTGNATYVQGQSSSNVKASNGNRSIFVRRIFK